MILVQRRTKILDNLDEIITTCENYPAGAARLGLPASASLADQGRIFGVNIPQLLR